MVGKVLDLLKVEHALKTRWEEVEQNSRSAKQQNSK